MTEYPVAVDTSIAVHTGSTIVGPVEGTVISDLGDAFFTIKDKIVASSTAIMDIPTHFFAPVLLHSHEYNPNDFPQGFFTVNGKPVATVGAKFTDDETEITEVPSGFEFFTVIPK